MDRTRDGSAMTDLLDIAPATAVENVTLSDGAEVTVHRLHFDQIAALAARFPKLIALLALGENALPQLISGGGAAAGTDHCGRLRTSGRRKG